MTEWLQTHRGVVFPWHCDHYGHMSARHYLPFFDDGCFHLWTMVGQSQRAMRGRGLHTVIARYVIDYLVEMNAGTLLVVESAFTRLGSKSVTHHHRMRDADTDTVYAKLECVEVFFDVASRESTAMPGDIRAALEPLLVTTDD